MKLYVLNSGTLTLPDEDPNAEGCDAYFKAVIPVPVYLLEHPTAGYVLIDTGVEPGLLAPFMLGALGYDPARRIDRQLKGAGIDPREVRHLIISHMHMDHFCQIPWFKDAKMHIRKREWEGASAGGAGYMPLEAEIMKSFSGMDMDLIPDVPEYDIFGDGSVVSVDTRGHTPGHQSLLIRLEKTGDVLLTFDACNTEKFFGSDKYFGKHSWDFGECHRAVQTVLDYKRRGAKIFFGHDAYQFKTLKKFPEYYE